MMTAGGEREFSQALRGYRAPNDGFKTIHITAQKGTQ